MTHVSNIQCPSCTLREHRESDKYDVVKAGYDPDLFAGIGCNIPSIPIEVYAEDWFRLKSSPHYSWAIIVDSICVGSAWIHSIEDDNRRGRFAIELHNSKYRSKGIGKEVIQAAMKVAFEQIKLHRLDLRVLTSNTTAINCYLSSGFKKEGVQRDTLFLNGRWESDLWMSILEHEYEELSRIW